MRVAVKNAFLVRKEQTKHIFMIDPRTNRYLTYWDITASMALLFVAVVTPYEVAYLGGTVSIDALFVVNRIIDAIFLVDLALQFFVCVEIQHRGELRWVNDPKNVAKNYLTGWFMIDFLCISSSSFDYIDVFTRKAQQQGSSTSAMDGLQSLSALRFLRTLRLMKLVKLLNGLKILKRYEVKIAINYSMLSLFKCIFGMLLLSHWFACVWGMQATFSADPLNTWLGSAGDYCIEDRNATSGLACKGPFHLYIPALYWAVMTLTSIGYGDIAATPGNTMEQLAATLIMVAGSMGWGLVLGIIVSNLSNLDPEGDAFTNTMSELNRMMVREGLPDALRIRLRTYFHQTQHIRATAKRTELLKLMSPTLRSVVAWEVNKEWLSHVWFLADAPLALMVQLSMKLYPSVLAPAEIAPVGPLYIVNRGLALYGGRIFSRGKYWGDDVILWSPDLQSPFCALAMTFLETFGLKREALTEVAGEFRSFSRKLRRKAVILACRRAFIIEGQKRLKAAGVPMEVRGSFWKRRDSVGFVALRHGVQDVGDEDEEDSKHETAVEAALPVGAALNHHITYKSSSNKLLHSGTEGTPDQQLSMPHGPENGQTTAWSRAIASAANSMSFTFSASTNTSPPSQAMTIDQPALVAAMTGALRNDIAPMLQAVLAGQNALKKEVGQLRAQTRTIAEEVKILRSSSTADVLSKLRA